MYRLPARVLLRQSRPQSSLYHAAPRISTRLLSTASPAQKSRGWKSSAARWALAIGGVYYYNTSDVFAEAPKLSSQTDVVPKDYSNLPTIESISERRKSATPALTDSKEEQPVTADSKSAGQEIEEGVDSTEGVGGLEEEDNREGAFNPETGEINWDCPCLGGMAHGPCGPEFRAAFSCFVYSQEEPKGMDCIEKFKGMQDCFRQHPDIYGEELDEEDDEQREDNTGTVYANDDLDSPPSPPLATSTSQSNPSSQTNTQEKVANTHSLPTTPGPMEEVPSKKSRARAVKEDTKRTEPESSGDLAPRARYDAKENSDK